MELNRSNARAADLIKVPAHQGHKPAAPILHFGVGGFHRAHQAWSLQQMINKGVPEAEKWGITGVCVLPTDQAFVDAFRKQDCLYFVQSFAANGHTEVRMVETIRELLFAKEDYKTILSRIMDLETKVISFTITEGGYNVNFNQHCFIWETPEIQEDLSKTAAPKTVFAILAEGLRKRMEAEAGGIALLSCDNIQHNGDILKFALMEFLKKYDPGLMSWLEKHVSFINTMVDRITPTTSVSQKNAFAKQNDFEDNCLVVCEDFFQWVIEKDARLDEVPYTQMGATLVDDVAVYEKMKLRLLNGGHSLTGLLGYALGYDRIHTSISDPAIREVFRQYSENEVIPTLSLIDGVSYQDYVDKLMIRFSNPMINDSTCRIISGSTDKLPKFVISVIEDQLPGDNGNIKWGALILAAWYFYLKSAFDKNSMQDVLDLNRDELLKRFSAPGFNAAAFIQEDPLFSNLKNYPLFCGLFIEYVQQLCQGNDKSRRQFIEQCLIKSGVEVQ